MMLLLMWTPKSGCTISQRFGMHQAGQKNTQEASPLCHCANGNTGSMACLVASTNCFILSAGAAAAALVTPPRREVLDRWACHTAISPASQRAFGVFTALSTIMGGAAAVALVALIARIVSTSSGAIPSSYLWYVRQTALSMYDLLLQVMITEIIIRRNKKAVIIIIVVQFAARRLGVHQELVDT